ncbi:hypothetical protein [Arthrobacter sp. UYEF3]|uniref:hypothetical protein n=1 Tax=Arthrobacter sp. UYEF3 TaxID=1756365 RepID=UPI0033915B22
MSDDAWVGQTSNRQARNWPDRICVFAIGVIVAATHGYLVAWNIPGTILECLVASMLWPLVAIFGVDLHTLIA